MTLKQLAEIYQGNILVNVFKAVEGGKEDVVTFEIEDADAIKEEILNAELISFEIKVTNNSKALASIEVMI